MRLEENNTKKSEKELLYEIYQDINELNEALFCEMKEIDKRNHVHIDDTTNLIDLYSFFEIPADRLLEEEAKKIDVQLSLDNLKMQKELLISCLK